MNFDDLSFETQLLHADRGPESGTSVAPPIYQTSSFIFEDPDAMAHAADSTNPVAFYTRHGNPNHLQVSRVLAAVEGGEAAVMTSSGMGAITATAMTVLSAGDHVVAQRMQYDGGRKLFSDVLSRYGVAVTFVDQCDVDAFAEAIRPETKLVWMESPSNPLLGITDIRRVAKLARDAGAYSAIDNTIATPYNQRPLALGVDLVVHSATKYLGGHSDLVAGAVIGARSLIERIWQTQVVLGATLSPFDAWLLLRGMRTLDLRVERHNRNAAAIATYLSRHPRVGSVYYPGLSTHPGHAIAKEQMRGFGGMLSFEIDGTSDDARAVLKRLRVIHHAVSLGGVESLMAQPAAFWPKVGCSDDAASMGVTPSMLRFAVGLENLDDLLADLDAALA